MYKDIRKLDLQQLRFFLLVRPEEPPGPAAAQKNFQILRARAKASQSCFYCQTMLVWRNDFLQTSPATSLHIMGFGQSWNPDVPEL